MSMLAQETAQILENLPPDKAQALLEYARYMAEKGDKEQWDRRSSDPKYAAKLKQMADGALAEFHAGAGLPASRDTV